MKKLKIRVNQRKVIEIDNGFVSFVRNSETTKTFDITYSNASGQTLTAGTVVHNTGITGSPGHLKIRVTNNVTLTSTGVINFTATAYPTAVQPDAVIPITILGSNVQVQVDYYSLSIIEDILIERPNRDVYTFLTTDFTDNATNYDGTPLADLALYGDLTGYALNGVAITPGQWISISDIAAGNFKYTALDQDAFYEKEVDYQIRDTSGNISE